MLHGRRCQASQSQRVNSQPRPLCCRTLDDTISFLPPQFLFTRQRIEGRMRRIVGDALRRIDNVWLVAAFVQWDLVRAAKHVVALAQSGRSPCD